MSDQPVHVTGGCFCGEVRYEADVLLKSGHYCHCGICQQTGGQASDMSVPVIAGTLKFVSGAPRYHQSSSFGERGFCPTCGSRLLWKHVDPELEWLTNITAGSLDNRAEAAASRHIFVESAVPWFNPPDSLPRYREEDMDGLVEVWRQERCGR